MWGSNLLWLSVNFSVFLIKVTAIHVYTYMYWHVFLLENSEEKNTIKSGHESHNDDYLWSSSVIVLFMLYLNIVIYFAEILWPSNLFVPVICYLLNLLLIHSFTKTNLKTTSLNISRNKNVQSLPKKKINCAIDCICRGPPQ